MRTSIEGNVLELGCGRNRDERATHFLDINKNVFTNEELACGVHKVGSVLDVPWGDSFFDVVLAIDVLEHLPYRATLDTLKEWRRVLPEDGLLYVQVPDAGKIMSAYSHGMYNRDDPRLPDELHGLPAIMKATWRIMGGQDDGDYTRDGDNWIYNLHCTMFDEQSLRWYAEHSGFVVTEMFSNGHPNLCCWMRAV